MSTTLPSLPPGLPPLPSGLPPLPSGLPPLPPGIQLPPNLPPPPPINTNGIYVAISKTTYMVTTGIFFAIAIIVSIARIIIHFRKWHRLFVADYFFLAALASLIASEGLWFHTIPTYYNKFGTKISPEDIPFNPKVLHHIYVLVIEGYVAQSFTWITIFCVKFSFLFYFRGLIHKVQGVSMLWWFTLIVLTPVAIVSALIGDPIACTHTGEEILLYCGPSKYFLNRQRHLVFYSVLSDILTDALLICIPILLLAKTKFKVRQKLSVGIVLTLSIFMIAIAVVRGVSAHLHGVADQTSATFWTQLEACISVTMSCMTAFKTLFTTHHQKSYELSPINPRYAQITPSTPRSTRTGQRFMDRSTMDLEAGPPTTSMRSVIRMNGMIEPGSDLRTLPPIPPNHIIQKAPDQYEEDYLEIRR